MLSFLKCAVLDRPEVLENNEYTAAVERATKANGKLAEAKAELDRLVDEAITKYGGKPNALLREGIAEAEKAVKEAEKAVTSTNMAALTEFVRTVKDKPVFPRVEHQQPVAEASAKLEALKGDLARAKEALQNLHRETVTRYENKPTALHEMRIEEATERVKTMEERVNEAQQALQQAVRAPLDELGKLARAAQEPLVQEMARLIIALLAVNQQQWSTFQAADEAFDAAPFGFGGAQRYLRPLGLHDGVVQALDYWLREAQEYHYIAE